MSAQKKTTGDKGQTEKKGTVKLTSLADLGTPEAQKNLKAQFKAPQWKKPDLGDLTDDAGKLGEQMKALATEVASAVKYLYATREKLAGLKGDDSTRDIAEALAAPGIATTEAFLAEQLTCETLIGSEPIPRRTAMMAYLDTSLSTDFHGDEKCVTQALNDLQARHIIELDRSGKGPIVIGIQHYGIPANWGLKERHVEKTVASVAQFSRQFMAMRQQHRVDVVRSMEARANIDLDKARKGKNGMCLVRVRGEPVVDAAGKVKTDPATGREIYHPGGNILVEFDDKLIIPLEATGGIERVFKDMLNSDVYLPRAAIGNKEKLQLDKRLSDSQYHLTWRFWKMMLNGIGGYDSAKEQESAKLAMGKRAEITAKQFADISGRTDPNVGKIAFLEFRGAFKFKESGARVYNPFILVRLVDEKGEGFIELVEASPHLVPILGKHVGKKFPAVDGFQHCPFGVLLRAIEGQTMQDNAVEQGRDELAK